MDYEINDKEEFESLPLRYAYEFLSEKGFSSQVSEIKLSKDKFRSYSSTLRRCKILYILERNNLFEEFIIEYWKYAKTDKGKRKIQKYKSIYESFLNKEKIDEEDEEESINESGFALEEHLRDYLADNLGIIENGLKLFDDQKGNVGVEYPVDPTKKRIDILAIDKNGIPVVIELKVSRGYERVIGQCLYYKNKVKELLKTDKVRTIIIAKEITSHLKIASNDLIDLELYEYNLSIKLNKK